MTKARRVLIAGGGIAGPVLAVALGKSGTDATLRCDRGDRDPFRWGWQHSIDLDAPVAQTSAAGGR